MSMRNDTQGILTSEPFYVDHSPVIVVDIPGFDDAHMTIIEVLKSLATLLGTLPKNKINGFLYMHNITDTRVGGTSLRNMNAFKAICGVDSLKNVVYVTNMWSDPPTQNELKREEELRESDDFFGFPLSHGAQMARHTNTKESAHNIIRLLLPKEPVVTKLWKQLVDERLDLAETDVGHVFEQEFKRDDLYQQQLEELANLKNKGAALEDENHGANKPVRSQPMKPESGYQGSPAFTIDPLADLQIAVKGQECEEERRSKGVTDHMEESWSNHQEKSKQRDEQIEDRIASITASAPANQKGHSAVRPTQMGWFDSCVAKIPVVGDWMGLHGGAPSARAPVPSRATPTAIDDSHPSTMYPSTTLESPTKNMENTFESSHPAQRSSYQAMRSGEERVIGGSQSRQPDGCRITRGEREGCTATSSKTNQDHEARKVVGRLQAPPPSYEP